MIAGRLLDRPWTRLSAIRLGQRERALACVLMLVAATWWAFTGYQRLNDAKEHAVESAMRLQQFREGRGDDRRTDYRRAVHREAVNLIDRSLQDPTIFLAQMRAQSQLQDFAIGAGMSAVQIGLDPIKASEAPLQQISLTVESEFNWRSLLAFFGSLESSRTSYFINAIDVAGVAPQQRVRVTLYVPYAAPGGPQ